jgi:hypothetical protein
VSMNPQTQSAIPKRANYLIALSGIRQSAFAMLTQALLIAIHVFRFLGY